MWQVNDVFFEMACNQVPSSSTIYPRYKSSLWSGWKPVASTPKGAWSPKLEGTMKGPSSKGRRCPYPVDAVRTTLNGLTGEVNGGSKLDRVMFGSANRGMQ